jgi:tRNA dimethylallyltransferase
MMYFRVLQQGLAALPKADEKVRAELQARAEREGWNVMHAWLASVDPDAARRIKPQDGQRIQRALEVFLLTGKTISSWQVEDTSPLSGYRVINVILAPGERAQLHKRIAQRFALMLELGFEDEVRRLYMRGDLTPDLPSIRSVGYRQMWAYLSGEINHAEMCDQAVAATRQLAKRQMTWLRSWPEAIWLDADSQTVIDQAYSLFSSFL